MKLFGNFLVILKQKVKKSEKNQKDKLIKNFKNGPTQSININKN